MHSRYSILKSVSDLNARSESTLLTRKNVMHITVFRIDNGRQILMLFAVTYFRKLL